MDQKMFYCFVMITLLSLSALGYVEYRQFLAIRYLGSHSFLPLTAPAKISQTGFPETFSESKKVNAGSAPIAYYGTVLSVTNNIFSVSVDLTETTGTSEQGDSAVVSLSGRNYSIKASIVSGGTPVAGDRVKLVVNGHTLPSDGSIISIPELDKVQTKIPS